MIEYFPQAKDAIYQHALLEYPNECCGVIVDGEYISCHNIHEDPREHFKLSPMDYIDAEKRGRIEAIIHSHIGCPYASKHDMTEQMKMGTPWGIVNMSHGGGIDNIYYWGDSLPIQDFIGRPFIHGIYDCTSLVRDWHIVNSEFHTDIVPRDFEWWKGEENVLVDSMYRFELEQISKEELRPGDIFCLKINSEKINHSGIYLGNNLILHHLWNRLSRREPLAQWFKYLAICFRIPSN